MNYYSLLFDANHGYWQVEIEISDRDKTAISSSHGLYRFSCLPLGFYNASGTFQQAMNVILSPVKCKISLVYFWKTLSLFWEVQTNTWRMFALYCRYRPEQASCWTWRSASSSQRKLTPSKCETSWSIRVSFSNLGCNTRLGTTTNGNGSHFWVYAMSNDVSVPFLLESMPYLTQSWKWRNLNIPIICVLRKWTS